MTYSPPRAPVERPTTVYLNDEEWLTVQTTPVDLEDWVLGYLCGEGVISRADQLRQIVVDDDRGLVWIDLAPGVDPFPGGRGTEQTYDPVTHDLSITKADALTWMQRMLSAAVLYHETGGIHVGAAIRVDTGEIIVREDIGRHNAIDKVIGALMNAKWPTEQVILLTSGRISYEMSTRLARCGIGIGISRTAATDQAYYLASQLGIELVGYARSPGSLTVYTQGIRIVGGDAKWS